jgi:hypothetical protein
MILFFVSLAMLCLLPISSVALMWCEYIGILKAENSPSSSLWFDMTMIGTVIAVCILIGLRCINIRSRIRVLEDGLSSIHSCAIVWEATILAHVSALQKLGFLEARDGMPRNMHGYTLYLAREAKEIADHYLNIHQWIRGKRLDLHKNLLVERSAAVQRSHARSRPKGCLTCLHLTTSCVQRCRDGHGQSHKWPFLQMRMRYGVSSNGTAWPERRCPRASS